MTGEQNQQPPCPRVIWRSVKPELGQPFAQPQRIEVRCRKWNCPTCGQQNTAKLMKAARVMMLEPVITVRIRAADLKKAWKRIRMRLPHMTYIAVIEPGPDAHLHATISGVSCAEFDAHARAAGVNDPWSQVARDMLSTIMYIGDRRRQPGARISHSRSLTQLITGRASDDYKEDRPRDPGTAQAPEPEIRLAETEAPQIELHEARQDEIIAQPGQEQAQTPTADTPAVGFWQTLALLRTECHHRGWLVEIVLRPTQTAAAASAAAAAFAAAAPPNQKG